MEGDDGFIGTWVGVNDRGIIRSGMIFRGGTDEEHAQQFVSEGGLRPVRLLTRGVTLDSPLEDYREWWTVVRPPEGE